MGTPFPMAWTAGEAIPLALAVLALVLAGIIIGIVLQWARERRRRESDPGRPPPLRSQASGPAGEALSTITRQLSQEKVERYRAEDALSQSQQRLRLHFERTPLGVIEWDADFRVVEWNPTAQHIFGYTRQEALGREAWELIVPESAKENVASVWKELCQKTGGFHNTNRNRRKDGLIIDCDWYNTPLVDAAGKFHGVASLCQDITERVRAEERLERDRRMFTAGPVVVFRWAARPGWPVEYVSPNVVQLFGYTADDLTTGRVPYANVVYPDDLDRVSREVSYYSAAGANYFEQDYRIVRPDGEVRWLYDFTVITRDSSGQITYYDGYVFDATARKQAEEERSRLATALEQADELIVISDREGVVQYANASYERVTGNPRRAAVGQNILKVCTGQNPDAVKSEDLWSTVTRGEVWSGRFTNTRTDGTQFQEEMTVSPIRDKSKRVINFVAVGRDITHEVELERQLLQAQKMEALGQLAGGVAHDFNNVLTVILGNAELLRTRLERRRQPADDLLAVLSEIEHAADHAAGLTRQLLAFSRRQVVSLVHLDLNALLANIEGILRRLVREDIELTIERRAEPATILADAGQIEQVLVNLAVNARDAMPDGGSLKISTRFAADGHPHAEGATRDDEPARGAQVLLSVTDTGFGMDRDTIKRIYDPFFTTKPAGLGTGLGLATVHGIVKQSGGDIEVQSRPGEGTTFQLSFPAVAKPAIAGPPEAAEELSLQGTETILLCEDHTLVRRVACGALEECGYTVLATEHAEQAINAAREYEGDIHLLLTDVIMPGMNGRQLASTVRQMRPNVEVLYISGYVSTVIDPSEMLEEGVHILEKPFTSEELARRVRQLLNAVRPVASPPTSAST